MRGIIEKRKGIDQGIGIAGKTVGGVDALPAIRTTSSSEKVGRSPSGYGNVG